MNNANGLLIILSGPSGVGKDTLINQWVKNNSKLKGITTCTTRQPRNGEVNGENYYFLSKEEFQRKVDENLFLEHKIVHGNSYGTPLNEVTQIRDQGYDAILEIDVQGALTAKEKISDAVMIFIAPPSLAILRERLEQRGTETQEQLELRLRNAEEEMKNIPNYEYVVVNDIISDAVQQLQSIIKAEKCRVNRYLNR